MLNVPIYIVNNFINFIIYFCKPYIILIIVQVGLSFIANYGLFTGLANKMNEIGDIIALPYFRERHIIKIVISLLIIWFVSQLCLVASNFIQAYIYPKIEKNARVVGFNIVQHVPVAYLSTYSDGYLENNITYASDSITAVVQNVFEDIIPNLLVIGVNIYAMFKLSKHLGLLILLSTITYFIILYFLARYRLVPAANKYAHSSSQRTNVFINLLNNRILNHVYNLKQLFLEKIEETTNNEQNAFINSRWWSAIGVLIRENIFFIFHGLVFILGGIYLVKHRLIPGNIIKELLVLNIAILASQFTICSVIVDLLERYGEGSHGVSMYKHLYQYILEYQSRNKNGIDIMNGVHSIDIKNLSLSHNNIKILNNVNLSISESSVVMFSGPSGCGKTTLVNIISGIYHHYTGDVLINNINIKEYKPDSLLNNISYIIQGTYLVEGTILSNIILDKQDVDMKQLEHQAENFNLYNLNKHVGVNGMGLSGGEKQRLCILRGIMQTFNYSDNQKHGKLIIADELTTNLDYNNANIAMKKMKDIANKNKSIMLVIEHSQLAHEHVDRIFTFIKKENSDIYEVVSSDK